MGLREKVAIEVGATVYSKGVDIEFLHSHCTGGYALLQAADRILAIPEIADALRYLDGRPLRNLGIKIPGEL